MRNYFLSKIASVFVLGFFALMPTANAIDFTNVSVHDPSVMRTPEGMYYIIGSHMGGAKSPNLIHWSQLGSSINSQPYFSDIRTTLGWLLDWCSAGGDGTTDTFWAGDYVRLRTGQNAGKYLMYYCSCYGSNAQSAIGYAIADSPEGKFSDLGPLRYSSGLNATINVGDGTNVAFRVSTMPNCVDPNTFYDKNGQLWMVYGSYSGGIFILQMNEDGSIADTDNNKLNSHYGKKIIGGGSAPIEGAYIMYSPDTEYYYLFLSFGGLASDGGYNVRVFRSKTADGTYTDNNSSHVLTSTGTQSESTMYNYGVKLVGNYKWSLAEGESWASSNDGTWVTTKANSVGYVSPGHNSAYYDLLTGRYFLVFHTRFYRGWEGHAVRVHEMFMNEDGWPVLAPYRYAGERQKEVVFKASDYPGTYKFVMHDTPKDTLQAASTEIVLGEDGSVTGSANFAATTKVTNKTVTGTWSVDALDPKKLTLELMYGTSTTKYTYHGFFLYQPDCFTGAYRICFTARRNNTLGAAIWGSKIKAGIPSFAVEDGALYRILNMNSGLWLEAAGSKKSSNIYLGNYEDSVAQVFRLSPVGNGYYQLQTKFSNYSMAVSVANASNTDNANITTIDATTTGNRTYFKLEDTGKGTFAILTAVSSDKRALNAYNGGVTDGTNVDQYSYSASSLTAQRQQWVLYKVSSDDTPIETINEDASNLEVFTLGHELKASLNTPGDILVYDMQGRIIKSAAMVTELTVMVNEPGAYLVVVTSKGATPLRKKILLY